jgi:cell wall-associated NlpC family hydrolase
LAAGRADTLSGSEGGDADAANDPSGKNASPDRGRRNSGRDAAGPEARIASPVSRSEENPAIDRHKVLNGIMNMMGSPYREGGSDTSGIDCSGFTAGIYRDAIGAEIPRACRDQFGAGEPVGEGRLKFGDLVFFNIDGRRLSHVGIYVGDGLFAHASVSLGITVSLLDAPYYKRWYAGARRILR